MFVIIEYKSEEYFTNIYVKGRDWLGKKGKRRKIGREQKLEGHVRLLGVPSNIVCESPSVEFRLIKCSTLFVAFVSLAAILSFDPFLLKSVLFVAAGSPKLRTLSRPRLSRLFVSSSTLSIVMRLPSRFSTISRVSNRFFFFLATDNICFDKIYISSLLFLYFFFFFFWKISIFFLDKRHNFFIYISFQ